MHLIFLTFFVAVMAGAALLIRHLTGTLSPWSMSFLHAVVGGLGVFMLGYEIVTDEMGARLFASFLVLLIVTASGLYLMSFHFKQKFPPGIFVFVHVVLALIGIFLMAWAFEYG